MSLIDKRLRAREQQKNVGGHSYTLRRPTAAQLARLADGTRLEMLRECVVGWDLKQIDLIPGGDPTPAEFDSGLWSDWLDDSPDIWEPLISALLDQIKAHHAKVEDAGKN
jgi:hypothetical protein